MILEANRIFSAWFANATHGINAKLAVIPLFSGHSRPTNIATITDETQDNDVAREELPATLPALAVSVDVVAELDGTVVTVTADGKLKLRVRIGVDNNVPKDAIRDLSYYLRAAVKSVRVLLTDAQNAARTLDSIYLEHVDTFDIAIARTKDQAGNAIIAGYLILTLQLRDLAP